MNSIGIVRKVDELGRIVIPKETRDLLYINVGDSLEIFTDKASIFLKKYSPGCIFCGDVNNLTMFKETYVCESCRKELENLEK